MACEGMGKSARAYFHIRCAAWKEHNKDAPNEPDSGEDGMAGLPPGAGIILNLLQSWDRKMAEPYGAYDF